MHYSLVHAKNRVLAPTPSYTVIFDAKSDVEQTHWCTTADISDVLSTPYAPSAPSLTMASCAWENLQPSQKNPLPMRK
jgi:hypothetical protein